MSVRFYEFYSIGLESGLTRQLSLSCGWTFSLPYFTLRALENVTVSHAALEPDVR